MPVCLPLSVYIAFSWRSNQGVLAARKPVCCSFYCFFTPHSTTCTLPLSLSPLACHDSVTLHLHLHAVNCCNSNWTSRPSVHTYIYSRIHIIELPVLLFLSSSPSVPVQFRASFCILLSSFWAMLFAFAAT